MQKTDASLRISTITSERDAIQKDLDQLKVEKNRVESEKSSEFAQLKDELERKDRELNEQRKRDALQIESLVHERDELMANLVKEGELSTRLAEHQKLLESNITDMKTQLSTRSKESASSGELADVSRMLAQARHKLNEAERTVRLLRGENESVLKEKRRLKHDLSKRENELDAKSEKLVSKNAELDKVRRELKAKTEELSKLERRDTIDAERQGESDDHKRSRENIKNCIVGDLKCNWGDIIGNRKAVNTLRALPVCLDPDEREILGEYNNKDEKGVTGILLHGPPGTVSDLLRTSANTYSSAKLTNLFSSTGQNFPCQGCRHRIKRRYDQC